MYLSLSFLNSPQGFLGTDTGGKIATLEVMTEGHGVRFDPDIGYWAEEWDPDGSLHPIHFNYRIGHRWVNATTLPMLFAAVPLYEIGGYRPALLFPMLGALAAAAAAAALARRAGGSARLTFWVVGLASPITIYALDFWEHSVGVALIAWAVVLLVDVVDSEARLWMRAAGAGALLGAAATMRTETLVYTAVAGVAVAALLMRRGAAWSRLVVGGAAAAVAFAAVFGANYGLERAVLGRELRTSRAAGTALAAGDAPTDRFTEAAITLLGAEGNARGIVVGAAAVALLAVAFLRAPSDRRFAMVALGGSAVLLLVRVVGGVGFVPGLFVAWPAAVIALLPRARSTAGAEPAITPGESSAVALSLSVAVGALPVVLATQFRGGAAPQWAGRYVLVSGLLMTAVALSRTVLPLRRLIVVIAAAVTVFGVAWMSVRTHDVERTMIAINAREEPVIVSTVAHLAREGGAFYRDKRWLTALGGDEVQEAADVVTNAGGREFLLVERDLGRARDRQSVDGWRRGSSDELELFDGVTLRLTRWQRESHE